MMKNILEINERILYLIDNQYNSNQKKFAESIGYAAQVVFNIVSGRKTKPSFDVLNAIISTNDNINSEWLLTGKGNVLKNEKEVLFLKNDKEQTIHLIPLYDGVMTASMISQNLPAQTEPVEMVNAGDWFRDATAAMRVHGDSMYPDYVSGSIIAMKEVFNKRLIIYGQDYMIETSEYRVIKRLQKSDNSECWLMCSTNTEIWEVGSQKGKLIHEPQDIHIDDALKVYQILGSVKRNHSSRVVTIE